MCWSGDWGGGLPCETWGFLLDKGCEIEWRVAGMRRYGGVDMCTSILKMDCSPARALAAVALWLDYPTKHMVR